MRLGVLAALLIWVPVDAFGTTLVQRRPDAGDVVADCYLWTVTPTTNSGSSSSLYSSYSSGEKRGLIRFGVNAIPPGSLVDSSVLKLNAVNADGRAVSVRRMAQPWAENTATWNSLDGGSATGSASSFSATVGLNSVDVTAQVQAWVDGAANYGFLLSEGVGTVSTEYVSSDNAAIDQRPLLEITWSVRDAGTDAGEPLDGGSPDSGTGGGAGGGEGGGAAGGGAAGDRAYLVGCSSAPVALLGWAALALLLARRRRQ